MYPTLPKASYRTIRCAPKKAPCPHCGKLAPRKRICQRDVRSLAYQQICLLRICYAEYQPRCGCCKSFRTHPPDVEPKAHYDNRVRTAVLDRLLRDRLNVEQTREALKRDFFLLLSAGFIYDCLRWQVARLDFAIHRRAVLERFSGTLCLDELHLGEFTLLLATDPLADLPVGFALVSANDQDHLRRFLQQLRDGGLRPAVVVTDGSGLYPAILAAVWPAAKHQLCVFHVLQDITDKVLQAVRRLRREMARRGKAGRKRRRGRPKAGAARRLTNKEKAAFVFRHRYLIVRREENLTEAERVDVQTMFDYEPRLEVLWRFTQEVYALLSDGQSSGAAWAGWARLRRHRGYRAVPELAAAVELLSAGLFAKVMVFLGRAEGERVRTNNHIERCNRRLRFMEKVRYKWRKRRWVVRWLVLMLDTWWREVWERPEAAREGERPAAA